MKIIVGAIVPNSKTNLKRIENLKENPVQFVKCCKCGNKKNTLYKVEGIDAYVCDMCVKAELNKLNSKVNNVLAVNKNSK